MKSLIKTFTLAVTIIASVAMLQPNDIVGATAMVQDCGCGTTACSQGCRAKRSSCGSCGRRSGCQQCPKCQTDVCTLETKEAKVKKSCFKTEQKIVCIPSVRLPWKKCCPPTTSKTRTVNVLKKHSYECPSCSYKWSLHEPKVPEQTPVANTWTPAPNPPTQPEMQYDHQEMQFASQAVEFEQAPMELPYERPQVPTNQPSFEQVPAAPANGWQPQK